MKIRVHFQDAENGFWLGDYVINVEPQPYWDSMYVLNFHDFHLAITGDYMEAKKNGTI